MYLNYGKYLAELFSIYSLPKKKQKYSFHKFYSTFELLLSNFIRTFSCPKYNPNFSLTVFSAIAVRNFFFFNFRFDRSFNSQFREYRHATITLRQGENIKVLFLFK